MPETEIERLRAENAALLAAIAPFADEADRFDCPRSGSGDFPDGHMVHVSLGHMRVASQVRRASEDKGGELVFVSVETAARISRLRAEAVKVLAATDDINRLYAALGDLERAVRAAPITATDERATPAVPIDARIEELETALAPFATWGAGNVDEDGWNGHEQNASIHTWFGPSEFRLARDAMRGRLPEGAQAVRPAPVPTEEDLRRAWAATEALRQADALNAIVGPALRAYADQMVRLAKVAGRPLHTCIPGDGTVDIGPDANVPDPSPEPDGRPVGTVVMEALEGALPLLRKAQEALSMPNVLGVADDWDRRNAVDTLGSAQAYARHVCGTILRVDRDRAGGQR